MFGLTNEQAFGILRGILTTAGGALATANPGWFGTGQMDAIIGGIMAVGAVVWSVISKRA